MQWLQARSYFNSKSPRSHETHRMTSKFAKFCFNVSLGYRPQKIVLFILRAILLVHISRYFRYKTIYRHFNFKNS